MGEALALGTLALGFLGSAHCVAMCGGFARAGPPLALHAGRIASYSVAGAIAGGLGAAASAQAVPDSIRIAALAVACLVLFVSGWRLYGLRVPLAALGAGFERLAARAVSHIGPPSTPVRRFLLGTLWGWAPCGLVYAALPVALVSGSASAGALAMAAFGLGTVPALLGAGWILARLGATSRRLGGALLMGLAVTTLVAHGSTLPPFCH